MEAGGGAVAKNRTFGDLIYVNRHTQRGERPARGGKIGQRLESIPAQVKERAREEELEDQDRAENVRCHLWRFA